jgi:hypothetical protein
MNIFYKEIFIAFVIVFSIGTKNAMASNYYFLKKFKQGDCINMPNEIAGYLKKHICPRNDKYASSESWVIIEIGKDYLILNNTLNKQINLLITAQSIKAVRTESDDLADSQ